MSYSNLRRHILCLPLLVFCTLLNAQDPCECTNCPVPITDNGSFDAILNVESAGANDLGACPLEEVCFTITHTWIGDLFVTLTSPGGLEYFVMADGGNDSGGCGLNQPDIDICVQVGTGNPITNNVDYVCNGGFACLENNWTVPCGGVSSGLTTAVQAPGCDLDAFNVPGDPVNGQWVLTVTDVCNSDVGFLEDWSMTFACGTSDCFTCSANAGLLEDPDMEACKGSSDLYQFPIPSYPNPADYPDPGEYGYSFVVVNNATGLIESIDPVVDLTDSDAGEYTVCGLSYYLNDAGVVASFVGQNYDVLVSDLASASPSFCGDLSDSCYTITVLDSPDDEYLEDFFCSPDCYTIGNQIICQPGDYEITLQDAGGCPYTLFLTLEERLPSYEFIQELVCEGETVTVAGEEYDPGYHEVFATANNGCDSITYISVTEYIFISGIYPLIPGSDSLSCENPIVQVEGYGSLEATYAWYNSQGVEIGNTPILDVDEPGCYDLIVTEEAFGIVCSNSSSICVGEIITEIETPILTGETFLCLGDTITYSVTNTTANYIDYHWTLPANVVILDGGQGFPFVQIEWGSIFTGDICLQAETECGLSDTECLSINFEFELEAPVVSGNDLVCEGDTTAYTAYTVGTEEFYWTIDGGSILSGQNTDEVLVLWSATGGSLFASGISYCGTGPLGSLDVAPNFPPSIAVISGQDTVCAETITSYAIELDDNTDSIFWDLPTCAVIQSGQNSDTITVLWPNGCEGGLICAETFNACGAGETDCFEVNVIQVPTIDSISGPVEVCAGMYDYIQVPVEGALDYTWSAAGAAILSGQGTNMVNIDFTSAGIVDLCVDASTNCHVLESNCIQIEVLDVIEAPVISGDLLVCPDSTAIYSIQNNSPLVDSYLWTVTCGTIEGDPTSASDVSIDWTSCPVGGTVCLTATGKCGETETTCLDVNMIEIPSAPVVSGPIEVCSFDTVAYTINVTDPDIVEIDWTIPTCATLISGQGSNEIQLVYSEFCGLEEVCVRVANSCSFGPEACIETTVITPPAVDDIDGDDVVCLGVDYLYSVSPVSEANDYVWTVVGGTISSGQGMSEVTVQWTDTGSQSVSLNIVTDCGSIPVSEFNVFVQSNMAIPEITGDALVCDSTTTIYSLVQEIPEATSYTWTSSCAAIVSGQGLSMIEVDWTNCTFGGQICVVANGPCDNSSQVCFDVDGQTNPEPAVVSGPSSSCVGSVEEYCAVSIGADAFISTVTGGQIVAGMGTDCISVEWETEGTAQVCFQTSNTCGLSPQVCVDVELDGLPDLPEITGNAQTCINESQTFELVSLESDIVNIEWTVSNGLGTVVLGQGTDEIEVNWLQGGAGQVCVLVENECGPTENCFDIVVTDMPAPNAGSDDVICGLSCSLTGSGGAGNASWSLVSGPGSITFSDANSFNTDVSVDVSGTYLFALELDDTGCISTDAVEVRFDNEPVLGQVFDPVCDNTGTNYTISFELLNGASPYSVTGLSGNWVGNVFYSDPILSGDSYEVEVLDANGCGPVLVTGSYQCPCISEVGTYAVEQLELCEGEVYDISAAWNTVLDANDILSYFILSDLPNPEITADIIIEENQDGIISFLPGMEYGQTYYVVLAVGNELAGNVDLTDPCLSFTEIGSFTYALNPVVNFAPMDQFYCEGDMVTAVFSVENDNCVDITLNDGNGNIGNYSCIADGDEIVLGPYGSGTYNLSIETVSGQTCQGLAGDPFTIIVNQVPDLELNTNIEVCNSTDSGNPTTLDLSNVIIAGSGPFTWQNLDACPVSGTMPLLDFEGVEPGDYSFSVSTNTAIAPCVDQELVFTVTVLDCTCPNLNVTLPDAYCNSSADVDMNEFLEDPTVSVLWTINSMPQVGTYQEAVLSVSNLQLTDAAPGVYELGLSLDGTAPVGCILENSIEIELSDQLNSGLPSPVLEFCEGVTEAVELSDLIEGEDTNGFWTEVSENPSTGGGFDALNGLMNVINEGSGLYQFEYTVTSDAPCLDQSTTVDILINPLPVASIESFDTITCVNLEVELTAYKEDTYTFEWAEQSDLNIVLGTNSSLTISESGAFNLQVVDSETGCVSTEEVEVPSYLEVPIPELNITDVNCNGYENGIIDIVNIEGGVSPYYVSFNEGAFDDSWQFTSLGAGTYDIAIEDAYGCVSNAEIEIEEPAPMEVAIDPLFNVSTGDFVTYGDSLQVMANLNVSMSLVDSISWYPKELVSCDTCLNTWLYPTETTTFNILIQAGACSATDVLSVFVKKEYPVYFPNIMSIGSNNEQFFVSANYMVEKVNSLKVFDRWGSLVFENYDFLPNNPALGWDGHANGKVVESGTYIYMSEIEFIDGRKELFTGDLTVIK